MRHAAAIALLIVAGAIAGAAVVELALRVATPGAPDLRGLHVAEPTQPWLYRLRPGAEAEFGRAGGIHYRINEDGFRGPRHAQVRSAGVVRIAVLGDSLTFGFGVEEAEIYTALLQAELADRLAPRRVEVLNFGVGGYNAYNEAELFAGVASAWQPDVVLVQFCINDLNDPRLQFDAHTLSLLELPDEAFPDPRVRGLPVPERSPLAFCTGRLRLCDRLQHAFFEKRADRHARARTLEPRRALEGAERDWLRTQYGKLAAWTSAHGAGFAVVLFPYAKQLRDPSRDGITRDVLELGREEGFAVIDLLPAFRAKLPVTKDPLYLDGWHPDPAGHRVAAEALADELARGDLLPAG